MKTLHIGDTKPLTHHIAVCWLERIVILGMAWFMLGMAILPSGPSYNPSKAYRFGLILTLILPTLALTVWRPERVKDFFRQPLMPWACALLAWGGLSSCWAHTHHPADGIARDASIFFFLLAWSQVLRVHEARIRRLLIGCGVGMALVALAAFLCNELHPPGDGRLVGFGVMGNSNLAAGGMASVLLWLWPWSLRSRLGRSVQGVAVLVLLVFVLLTRTRSVWGGLFVALEAMLLVKGPGRPRWLAVGLLVLGAIAAVVALPMLSARGWSSRPEIFAGGIRLFMQHPWLGWGQGSDFSIVTRSDVLTHAHNLFIQLGIELGLPGLLLWLGIWLALGWTAWRHRHKTLAQIVLGLWVFASIVVQFDLPYLLDSPRPDWLITWLPLALAMSLRHHTASDECLGDKPAAAW